MNRRPLLRFPPYCRWDSFAGRLSSGYRTERHVGRALHAAAEARQAVKTVATLEGFEPSIFTLKG